MAKLRVEAAAVIFIVGLILGSLLSSQNLYPTKTTVTETIVLSTAYSEWKTTTIERTITVTSPATVTAATTAPNEASSAKILGVYFSPNGGCARQVIYWIGRANKSVHVLIYSFTLTDIADALIEAKNRGVDVKVVFEKGQVSQYSQYFRLANAGVNVRNDTNPDLMHNKVAVIDGVIVLTGSYNWSSSAENSNNENLIIVMDVNVAREYEIVFDRIWAHGR